MWFRKKYDLALVSCVIVLIYFIDSSSAAVSIVYEIALIHTKSVFRDDFG